MPWSSVGGLSGETWNPSVPASLRADLRTETEKEEDGDRETSRLSLSLQTKASEAHLISHGTCSGSRCVLKPLIL